MSVVILVLVVFMYKIGEPPQAGAFEFNTIEECQAAATDATATMGKNPAVQFVATSCVAETSGNKT